jgi:hypothetical protein
MQLKAAKRNYPIHEKELLVIVRALKKWRSDLLGSPIYVYTDHKTLENFDTQKDLSRHQLRWQEFFSQYEINMIYIPGPDNTVADALSRLPDNPTMTPPVPHEAWVQYYLLPQTRWCWMPLSVAIPPTTTVSRSPTQACPVPIVSMAFGISATTVILRNCFVLSCDCIYFIYIICLGKLLIGEGDM